MDIPRGGGIIERNTRHPEREGGRDKMKTWRLQLKINGKWHKVNYWLSGEKKDIEKEIKHIVSDIGLLEVIEDEMFESPLSITQKE